MFFTPAANMSPAATPLSCFFVSLTVFDSSVISHNRVFESGVADPVDLDDCAATGTQGSVTLIWCWSQQAQKRLLSLLLSGLKTSVWEKMGASATVPVAEQAASSGDCSTVNLEVCNPSQDGTSFMPHQPAAAMQSPAQHAQQAVTSLVSRQPAVQDQAAASRAGRHLRKRKQPPSEEGQQRAAGSTSMAANAARGKTLGVNKEQAGLVPVSLHCKGHQQGSDLSGGQPEAPTNSKRRAAACHHVSTVPTSCLSSCTHCWHQRAMLQEGLNVGCYHVCMADPNDWLCVGHADVDFHRVQRETVTIHGHNSTCS